jgi:2-hydroxychromene-2-carboxylate isomerase
VHVDVVHFTDPGCPFAWAASPSFATLRHRFGGQLRWRHVMIGLTEDPAQYVARGYTPLGMAQGQRRFRRHGMPMSPIPKQRVAATGRSCRAIVAVRLESPERELAALRALQILQFCTGDLLDDDAALARALDGVPDVDGAAIVARIDSREVVEAYELDRAETRTAAGTAPHAQGKTAETDGPVRFTAPSVIFRSGGRELTGGGWQPLEAYDVLLANLEPGLVRRPPAASAAEALEVLTDGLATAEVAAVMEVGMEEAEDALLDLVVDGAASRTQVGNDALWTLAGRPAIRLVA